MKKLVLFVVGLAALGVAVGGGLLLVEVLGGEAPEWTTRSDAARDEFEQGLLDLRRLYWHDARGHFERALDLDPRFTAAKLYLNYVTPERSPEFERLLGELAEVDQDDLSRRERYLVRLWLALRKVSDEAAQDVLGEFLAAYPEDFFALAASCDLAWDNDGYERARDCYADLVAVHPNWLMGLARLGKVSMALGRFDDAEESFKTFAYVAPDQPQAYVALAQLFILTGRYEESEEMISKVLELDEGACVARATRIRLQTLAGRFDEARAAIDDLEAVEGCSHLGAAGAFCSARASVEFLRGDFEASWDELTRDGCFERLDYDMIGHRVALMTGHEKAAAKLRAWLEKNAAEAEKAGKLPHRDWYRSALLHAEGFQLAFAGKLEAASEKLRQSDEILYYWVGDLASFKLFNRQTLLYVLRMQGKAAEAEALQREIDAVNPHLAEEFRLPDMELLAARRGQRRGEPLLTKPEK